MSLVLNKNYDFLQLFIICAVLLILWMLHFQLKRAVFDHQTLNYGPADIFVKVLEFM